jgi:lysophospholipase L1-like esterase
MGTFLTLQVANGNAFLLGLVAVILASVGRLLTDRRNWQVAARISAVVGVAFIIASATPVPAWVYELWFSLFLTAFALQKRFRQTAIGATLLLVLLSISMFVYELSYRRVPVIPMHAGQAIYVIGDSISAGIRNEQHPWPQLLRQSHGLDVINLAQAGATVETALLQVQGVERSNCVVILEIGGNDFFGETKSSEFAAHLDRLLATLASRGHTLAMFELPLLPFHNAFGRAQRTLAAKYHVVLVSKTYLARILGTSGATVDGLHLSRRGHEAMANMVFRTLQVENPLETAASSTAPAR